MAYGATADDWAHFASLLGLTPDLLPVVSNPSAKPSPRSKLKTMGKVPSVYGADGVYGIGAWTSKTADHDDIRQWSQQPDYGICIQTRTVRAIDVDITDPQAAADVLAALPALPRRTRPNASKFLCVFYLPGELPKRVIKTAHGAIELLGTGQQFIACGTHPSGARYEWAGGLPDDVPALTIEQFEALWALLASRFGIESTTSAPSTKAVVLAAAATNDPVAQHLMAEGMVKSTERDGRLHIRCPFEDEHTSAAGVSDTTYFPAHTGGYERGHFKCLHAHCEHRSDDDFRLAVGVSEFDAVPDGTEPDGTEPGKPARFTPLTPGSFIGKALVSDYHIKGVLDRSEIAFIYGESTAGKTFVALDMAYHIATGTPWRERRVSTGRVWYVCCEGVGGFSRRLAALCQHHGITDIPNLHVVTDTPSLLNADYKPLAAMIAGHGGADIVFVDTWSRAIAGGDENSAETVTKALAHVGALHKLTGATVALVAHAGKDTTRGIRGHSSTKGSADVQIEVRREGDGADTTRSIRLEKVKDGDGEGLTFGFALSAVRLGVDQDGDEVSSCVVREAAAPKAQRPLGAVEKLVIRVLEEARTLDTDDVGMPATTLQDAVMSWMAHPESGKRDRRRELLTQALLSLVADRMLDFKDQRYFLKG